MKTISIKNLTLQVDIFKAHGNMVADAQTAIDLINKALENEPRCLGAQILYSSVNASDIEDMSGDDNEEDFRTNFNIIETPTAKGIFESKVEVFGFSLKDGSDFFFEDESIEEIQAIIDLKEFIFGTTKK